MNSLNYGVKFHAIILAIEMGFVCMYYESNGQEQSSTLVDRDGNIYTIKILPDNKKWMTVNLNINIPGSYCYENVEQNCNKYGRLYTWKSAKEGCYKLGEGWRLPSNEEWRQMARRYGGVRDDSDDSGKAAYKALLYGGNAEFNALLGGGRESDDGRYARMEAHGFYWTATESDSATAWLYNFGKGPRMLNRHKDGEKQMAFSVRCIREIGNLKEQR